MLLDPVALAWASWAGLGVGVVGTLVSLVGLILTFREARRAGNAASRASAEVARAIGLLQSRTRLAAVSTAVSRADLLLVHIRRDALTSNPEMLTEFRRLIREAFAGASIASSSEPLNLRVLEEGLERIARLASSEAEMKVRRAEMVDIFEGIRTQIIAYEADARSEIIL